MRAVGMAGKEWQQAHSLQNRHCRQTQPADDLPGSGLKTTASSWPALQQKQQLPEDVGLPPAVQCR